MKYYQQEKGTQGCLLKRLVDCYVETGMGQRA
jgi:hypothetical protein